MMTLKQSLIGALAVALTACAGDAEEGSGAPENETPSLEGGEWVVEDINEGGVIDMTRVTMTFGEDGVSGSGGCNSYSGSYEVNGNLLTIGPVAATRKACPPAIMNQEFAFFGVLENAERFDFTEDGALTLSGADGKSLLARR